MCKNEFKDNNEKLCSWTKNRVSHKIDFKAVWPRNGHAASGEVKFGKLRVKTIEYELFISIRNYDWLWTSGSCFI